MFPCLSNSIYGDPPPKKLRQLFPKCSIISLLVFVVSHESSFCVGMFSRLLLMTAVNSCVPAAGFPVHFVISV